MASTVGTVKSLGNARVTSAARGVPAIAATSLRQRASALRPTFSGAVSRVKWMPSTTASVLKRRNRSGRPRSSTAQSSPAPVTTERLAGSERVKSWMSSNSFTGSKEACAWADSWSREDEVEKVHGVEDRVGEDGSHEVIGLVVEQGEDHRKKGQRDQGHEVGMDGPEEQRTAVEAQPRVAQLLDGPVKNAPKKNLLDDRRHQDGSRPETNALPERHGQLQHLHGGLHLGGSLKEGDEHGRQLVEQVGHRNDQGGNEQTQQRGLAQVRILPTQEFRPGELV